MRGLWLFIAGVVAASAVHLAVAQTRNGGIVGVNHVGISVSDLDAAVAYYTETLGFPEAFRALDANGNPVLVYVQVSRDTFVELQPASAQRPPGVNHFGIHVEDMESAIAQFRARGADVSDSRLGSTNAVLANVTDLNGIRIELSELPPESLQSQAIERWREPQ
jgi:catechol 2,3-dioxygenase-like lactoylglutathione lyase family enzyme